MASNTPPKDAPGTAPKPVAVEPLKIVTRSFAPDKTKASAPTPQKAPAGAPQKPQAQVPAPAQPGKPQPQGQLALKPAPIAAAAKPVTRSNNDPFEDATFKSRRFTSNTTLDETMKKLQDLEKLDQLCELKLKKALIMLVVSVLAAIIATILFGNFGLKALLFIIAEIPIAGFFVFALLNYLHYKKLDLSNEFRTFLMPVLKSLRNDLKKDSSVNLNVDLEAIDAKKYLVGKSAPYESGSRKKCVDTTYARQLFKMALRLEDKNTLVVNCSEKQIKTSFRKSSGGKIKFKNKVKENVDFDLRLLVNKDAYAVAPPPDKSEVVVKAHPKGTMLCVKYKEKFKAADVQPNKEMFLERLIQLYSYLGPLKKTA